MNEFFLETTLGIFKDMLYVKAISTPDQEKRDLLEYASIGFDQIIYRLTVKSLLQTFTYQWKYVDFDYSRSIYIFQCFHDNECIEQLAIISNTRSNSSYYFDMSVFHDITNLAQIGQSYELQQTCFQRVIVEISSRTSICVVLEKSQIFTQSAFCMKFLDGPVTFSVKAIDVMNNSYKGFSQTSNGIFQFSSPRLFINCIDCEAQIQDLLNPNVILQLTLNQNNLTMSSMGNQVTKANYKNVKIVVFTVSAAVLIACIVESIVTVVIFCVILKTIKRHRAK